MVVVVINLREGLRLKEAGEGCTCISGESSAAIRRQPLVGRWVWVVAWREGENGKKRRTVFELIWAWMG